VRREAEYRPAKPDKTAAIITATKPIKLVLVSEGEAVAEEEVGYCVMVTPTVRMTSEPHLETKREDRN
jgi:hypothetical protein